MKSAASPRRAVIDVGTNSVKLLVADVEGARLRPVAEESITTRLGAGFYETRRLGKEAIAKTAAAAANYAAKAKELGASSVRIIGTSAARDARNGAQLAEAIRQESGLAMRILSGKEEAEWAFRGVASDPRLARWPALVLDVGGGSTEFILSEKGIPRFSHSYEVGVVRLLEQLRPGDPPGLEALGRCRAFLREMLDREVAPALEPALRPRPKAQLVGMGGTAIVLARMDAKAEDFNRAQIEATILPAGRLRTMLETLWRLPLAKRREIPGLPADRADIILTGAAIYEAIMERFGFKRLRISTRGLRYWALLQGWEQHPNEPVPASGTEWDSASGAMNIQMKKGGRHCSVRPPNNQTNQPLSLSGSRWENQKPAQFRSQNS
jgi:exopolyphosphatase/guanosine-5'-triphosphate,3'-diphosphate pyrophosphatase